MRKYESAGVIISVVAVVILTMEILTALKQSRKTKLSTQQSRFIIGSVDLNERKWRGAYIFQQCLVDDREIRKLGIESINSRVSLLA